MRFLISFLALILASGITMADHLLGGEVTYQHITGTQYKIHVTLYRDCNGSRLGGTGGGGTSDHLELKSAHLETVPGTNCSSSQYLGKISLQKLDYENITPVCGDVRTACEENSSFNYGIEAHHYVSTTLVNFENYSAYSGCNIRIYISISDRSDDLTTLNGGTIFYNYAIINPWINQSSSPEFNANPQFLYAQNTSVRLNPMVKANSGDSLSFKWSSPYKGSNDPMEYQSGYSAQRFIQPYCPGGDCSADPDASIPVGIYLDNTTGDYVFTPTVMNQLGVMVIEVEQWKRINGDLKMVGLVRRDAVVAIVLQNPNNNPEIDAGEVYEVCVGDEISFTISASDLRYTLPDGSISDFDSVQFAVETSIDAIMDSAYSVTQAPYSAVDIRFSPDESMVGEHYVWVEAQDNYCPVPGISRRKIKIRVNPLPEFDFTVEDLFCGNNKVSLQSSSSGSASLEVWNNELLFSESAFTSEIVTSYVAGDLDYRVTFTTDKSCTSFLSKNIKNKGNSTVKKATIVGDLEYCENANFDLALRHKSIEISECIWAMGEEILSTDTLLSSSVKAGIVDVTYTLKKGELECQISDEKTIKVNPSPEIVFDQPEPVCQSLQVIALEELNVSPAGGNWTSDIPIKNNALQLKAIPNTGNSYFITYEILDSDNGCSNSITNEIVVLESPEMELEDVVLCGATAAYRLSNSIVKPLHFTPENITWSLIDHTGFISGDHPLTNLDIPGLGTGKYFVEGTNTADNGCVAVDTSWIRVDEGLTLTTNGNTTICQGESEINLVEYLEINAPGGLLYSNEAVEMLNGSKITPRDCGVYEFNYTYDAFGCYAQMTFDLTIVCKPELELNLPQQLCENSNEIELPAADQGEWSGIGVRNNTFYPEGLAGIQQLTFLTDKIDVCVFDSEAKIEVLAASDVQVLDYPEHLCEGEILVINYSKDDYSTLDISTCNSNGITVYKEQIKYTPSNCDLNNKAISLSITANTNEYCPESKTVLEIPYSPLPRISTPAVYQACFPAELDQSLSVFGNSDAQISYRVSNSNYSHEGTGNVIEYKFPASGVYDLDIELRDNFGCENTQRYGGLYKVHAKPTAAFGLSKKGVISLSDRSIYLYNHSGIDQGQLSYTWSYASNGIYTTFSNASDPYFELPLDTGQYSIILEASSSFGCVDTAVQEVFLVPDMVIFIPNAFSPNNTGPSENNEYQVSSLNAKDYHIRIYNKWGQMVYESFDINESWDGTYLGKPCEIGVYLYRISVTNQLAMPYEYSGTLNLLR